MAANIDRSPRNARTSPAFRRNRPQEEAQIPRIAYKRDAELDAADPIVTTIQERRGGELIALDRMLLHSPQFARGWNAMLGAVRGALSLPPALRELAICAVAVLNGADYEYALHGPEFLKAGGSPQQLEAIKAIDGAKSDEALFDSAERATLLLAIEMTRRVKVTDTSFAAVRQALGADQPVVELIGVIATYNMVSRFLVALEIEPTG